MFHIEKLGTVFVCNFEKSAGSSSGLLLVLLMVNAFRVMIAIYIQTIEYAPGIQSFALVYQQKQYRFMDNCCPVCWV